MNPSVERSTLPALSEEEREHSEAVGALLRRHIVEAGGWIPFDSFMETALYAPGLGYYSAGSTKLGAAGDFTTAPELSELFSLCVARQAAEILATTGGSILELGAGTGRMAATVLSELAERGTPPLRYEILEVSADLRARQQDCIGRLPRELQDRVHWLERLPEKAMSGVMLANEVLDALPCKRFVMRGTQVFESGIALDGAGSLVGSDVPADARFEGEVAAISASLPAPFADGYRSEICPRVAPWIASLADRLERGAILLFDYGLPRAHYYHPQRAAGTLRCHFKQRAHSQFLLNIAVQDITAWVDFTGVARAADEAGLEVSGFATQAAFLLGNGIEEMMTRGEGDLERARLASQARQLMLPGEMGEIFKAMALTRGLDEALRGFAVQDLRRLL